MLSARVNGGRAAYERDERGDKEESSFFNDKRSLITSRSDGDNSEALDDASSVDTATLSTINKHLKDIDTEINDIHMIMKVQTRKIEAINTATGKLKEQMKNMKPRKALNQTKKGQK